MGLNNRVRWRSPRTRAVTLLSRTYDYIPVRTSLSSGSELSRVTLKFTRPVSPGGIMRPSEPVEHLLPL